MLSELSQKQTITWCFTKGALLALPAIALLPILKENKVFLRDYLPIPNGRRGKGKGHLEISKLQSGSSPGTQNTSQNESLCQNRRPFLKAADISSKVVKASSQGKPLFIKHVAITFFTSSSREGEEAWRQHLSFAHQQAPPRACHPRAASFGQLPLSSAEGNH